MGQRILGSCGRQSRQPRCVPEIFPPDEQGGGSYACHWRASPLADPQRGLLLKAPHLHHNRQALLPNSQLSMMQYGSFLLYIIVRVLL